MQDEAWGSLDLFHPCCGACRDVTPLPCAHMQSPPYDTHPLVEPSPHHTRPEIGIVRSSHLTDKPQSFFTVDLFLGELKSVTHPVLYII